MHYRSSQPTKAGFLKEGTFSVDTKGITLHTVDNAVKFRIGGRISARRQRRRTYDRDRSGPHSRMMFSSDALTSKAT